MKKIIQQTTTLFLFLTLSCSFLKAQEKTGSVSGMIITTDSIPAEGVTVLIKNTSRNAVTDNKGRFSIHNLKSGVYDIIISLIGYQDQEQTISVENGRNISLHIKLDLTNNELDQVVVVSNKNNFKTNRTSASLRLTTPILEIPQNIQVLTAKTISDQQIFDMLEGVTRNVSGAAKVEHWDNYARITMRGSRVGAFRNGLNVTTDWGPLTEDMSMVERIEFIKGPAGFMLSNGDPSGFYNIVTKKPSGRNKGEISLSLGSYDLYRATADIDGVAANNKKIQYRLNIMGQVKGSHRPYDYNNRYGFVPVIKYLIDNKSSITLEYSHQSVLTSPIGTNYLFSKKGYADLPGNFTFSEPNLPSTRMTENNILGLFEHKIDNNWKFTAQTSFIQYDQKGLSLWPSGFTTGNDSFIQRAASNWDVLGITKGGQMFINGQFNTGIVLHKLLAGVDMSSKDYYHDWSQNKPIGSPFNIYNPIYGLTAPLAPFDRELPIRERGVRYYNIYQGYYVQDELSVLNNKLRFTFAGRYTRFQTTDPYSGSVDHKRITPRIGLSWSIDKNTAAYFVYDQAMIENFGHDWQGKSFDPVVGANLELGIKKDWLNGKWNSGLTIYQITRNNMLTTDIDHPDVNNGGYFSRESGQQRTKGIEADIKGKLTDNLDVIINYAFTEAKITKDSDPNVIGNQVAGSSKHVQNTWLNYRLDKGALAGLGFSVGYQLQSKRAPWYVFDNSEQQLPDYFRLDGGISYAKEKISFNLVVNNILNSYLYSGAYYNWGNYYYWQAETGTNFRFTVGYKF